MPTTRTLSKAQARRIALSATGIKGGLPENQVPTEASWSKVKASLAGMKVLQLDAINTIIRTQYLPVYSRLGHYDRQLLDTKLFEPQKQTKSKRAYFEYWGHECSVMSLSDYPLLHWRMRDAQQHQGRIYDQCVKLAKKRPGFLKEIKSAIANHGPLPSRDLEKSKRGPGMWQWSDTKQALEYLFWTGEITTRGRQRFERLYDLTENSIPAAILDQCTLSREDAQAQLCENSLRTLGIGTTNDIRDYYRLSAKDANPVIQRLVEEKRIEPVEVEGTTKTHYWIPGTPVPKKAGTTTLVSPFDPLIWNRDRTERLFDFNYRIEIYVPEKQRQYGYYVLPFLYDENLVARVDLKSDRQNSQLRVQGVWWESDVAQSTEAEQALALSLERLAHWLKLEQVLYCSKSRAANSLKKQARQMGNDRSSLALP